MRFEASFLVDFGGHYLNHWMTIKKVLVLADLNILGSLHPKGKKVKTQGKPCFRLGAGGE